MERGILLEMERRTAIVLTPGGEFRRIPAPAGIHEIGDEVSYAPPRPTAWLRWGVAAVAAVILAVGGGGYGYQTWALAQPVAIVSIDINPSIELTLNKKDQVLRANGMNDDGKAILQGLDWSRQPVSDVIDAVTARAVDAGKLNPEDATGTVLVAVFPATADVLAATVADQIRSDVKGAVVSSVSRKAVERQVEAKTSVAAVRATGAERDEAFKSGLTPGKFVLLKELQAQKAEITLEQLQSEGPSAVLRRLGIDPSDVLPQAEKDHGGQVEARFKKEQGTKRQTPAKDEQGKGQQDGAQGNPFATGQQALGQQDNPKDQGSTKPADKPNSNGRDNNQDNGTKNNQDTGQNNGQSNGKDSGKQNNQDNGKDTGKDNGKDNGKNNNQDNAKGNKSSESDSSWHLPWGITLPKPGFLHKDTPPSTETPRAKEPGAESRNQNQKGKSNSEPKASQKSGH